MEDPLAIGDVPASVVCACCTTVTLVAPVSVVNAESEGRVRVKLVVEPLVIAVAVVPVNPCGSRATSDAVMVPPIELPPIIPDPPLIMLVELLGITLCPT